MLQIYDYKQKAAELSKILKDIGDSLRPGRLGFED